MDKVIFFELEISRLGLFGAETSATGFLPATPYELRVLLEKVRITDERVIYSIEILDSRLDYLSQFISSGTNLYELNHLANEAVIAMQRSRADSFVNCTAPYY